MGVAHNIAALLTKFEISQNAFAANVDVSPGTVSRWRSGTMTIRQANLDRICEAYDLVPDDILSDSHGLAAQVFGDQADRFPVPLLNPDNLQAYMDGTFQGPVEAVEVTVTLHKLHPHAFALRVQDDAMNLRIPLQADVVVDPQLEPHDASTVAITAEVFSGASLRKLLTGRQTSVYTAESTEPYDDIVVADDGPGVQVLGTVVWFQAPKLMA